MGHFCFICDNKLGGGITPTTCDCIESCCDYCWSQLFETQYETVNEPYYKKGLAGEYILETKELKIEKDDQRVFCPHCNTEFLFDSSKEY